MTEKRVIGLTGGVGSGKSTVLNILRQDWSAAVLEADRLARELMEPGGAGYGAVAAEFGPDILTADGAIDRARLSDIVYASEERRLRLNALTHPLVRREAERRIAAAEGLVVYEAALPEEACLRELCGEVWYVRAPAEVRVRRLMASRGYTREKSRQIIASQRTDEEFAALSDRVIENGGTLEETRKQLQTFLNSGIISFGVK